MKKALVLMLTAVFMLAMAGLALAEMPGELYPTADDGSSYWTYQDLQDGTAKTQGAYKAFDSGTISGNNGMYTTSPHGGYDTTTNKCKVCHAVHRAQGAYFLLRADTQDDACAYCHLDGSAHSAKVVYTLNPAGPATPNGHTIGASSVIPDSSVQQTTEDVVLQTMDENMNPISETVAVRRYNNTQNKMFRFARHHGHGAAAAGRSGYKRIGPLSLRCMNCHQPHNAKNMVWNPWDFKSLVSDGTHATPTAKTTNGYKLLRKSPSASIWGDASNSPAGMPGGTYDDYMVNRLPLLNYDTTTGENLVGSTHIITVPEDIMDHTNTGNDGVFPNTIYTAFPEGEGDMWSQNPQSVNQYALSPWCADCHNLNIGYWKHLANAELGFKSHSDRTHPAPYTGSHNGPAQCYSCHRNDLPTVLGTTNPAVYNGRATGPNAIFGGSGSCEQCHFGTASYAATIAAASPGTDSGYDFPHSGNDNSIKLLGDYSINPAAPTVPIQTTITKDNLDAVCIRCHGGIGVNH